MSKYPNKRILAVLIAFILAGTQLSPLGHVLADEGDNIPGDDISQIESETEESEGGSEDFLGEPEEGSEEEFEGDPETEEGTVPEGESLDGETDAMGSLINYDLYGAFGTYAAGDADVPIISEDFENMTAENPPTDGWGIPLNGYGTPTANAYVNTAANGTYFGAVSIPGALAETTNAFEFAVAGSEGSRGRGLQKNFTAVEEDIVELDFDWNIGTLEAGFTWLSIKDSEFNASGNDKGFRYLALVVEYSASDFIVSYSVDGGRDGLLSDTTGNSYATPENRQTLFTNVPQNTWYNVHVTLDFTQETTSFTLTEKASPSSTSGLITKPFPSDLASGGKLDFGAISFCARGANAVQKSGYADCTVKMYIDNFNVYGYEGDAESHSVTVNSGMGSGSYKEGSAVTVTAENLSDGTVVKGWTVTPSGLVLTQNEADPFVFTFKMPAQDVTLTPVYGLPLYVTVINGIGGGSYEEGNTVTVRADKGTVDRVVTGWTKTPADLEMTQSKADPSTWTFTMPDGDVSLEPVYAPYSVSAAQGYKYYFKSNYYSAYEKPSPAPRVQFYAEGAVSWESNNASAASVAAGTDTATAVITAGNPGMAVITAKDSNGAAVGIINIYVPSVSEDFENPPTPATGFDLWNITDGGDSGSPSSNTGLPTGASQFGVVVQPDADGVSGNHAFEFASGRGDTTFRGVQKRFSPVKQNVVELDFDWNIGDMARTSTWLSIKDSEFGGDTSSDKGFRYLSLKVDYVSASSRRLYYDSGKRDATGDNDFLTPASTNSLFGGASQSPYTWYGVHVSLDYINKTTTFSLTNKATGETTGEITTPFPGDLIAAGNLDFGAISIVSAGAGNNSSDYASYPVRMYVDNFNVYGYDYPPQTITVSGALLDNGAGSASYNPGDTVTVTVEAPKDGMAFRAWEISPSDIVMAKDADNPLKWTFTMPANDVSLTAIYGVQYELVIGSQSNGGAGKTRELTIIGDITDKYLLVRLTETNSTEAKTSEAVIKASENAIISYQKDTTKIEVLLIDFSRDTIYASAFVEGR